MPKRIDLNQPTIVAELRQMGFPVCITSDLGKGFPDLVVGGFGTVFLFEVKNPEEKWTLTEKEQDFHDLWQGMVHIIQTTEDAISVMTSSRTKT